MRHIYVVLAIIMIVSVSCKPQIVKKGADLIRKVSSKSAKEIVGQGDVIISIGSEIWKGDD